MKFYIFILYKGNDGDFVYKKSYPKIFKVNLVLKVKSNVTCNSLQPGKIFY